MHVARPQGQVVTEQLHNQRAVLVRFLGKRIQFSDGIVESLLGQLASTIRRVEDLVVEDGKVQSQTQANRVRRGQLGLSNVFLG